MHAPRGSAADLAAYPLLPDPLPLPLSLAQRQQAISHEGGLARLRCLLDKLDAGGNVTMAVLGGSTPKSWYQSYARRPNGVRRTVASVPLSHSEDLAFTFHRQWGHEANEDMLEQLARFYDLPSISLRNVLWHHMKANTTFNGLRLPQLYYDRIHPSDYGHTILAHGLAHLVKRTQAVLSAAALEEAQAVLGPNVAGAASRRLECHDADSLHALVDRTEGCPGWAYTLERSSSGVPKPGWIATSAGARCTFAYTLSPGSSATHRIGIGYLKSYERMGRVQVQCVHQCACGDGIVIDAHHRERISPLDLIYVSAHLTSPAATPPSGAGATATNTRTAAAIYLGAGAMPARCGLRLTVLNASSSGDHKFKLTALFMNQHGDASYFGRWIFNQAAEARGAVEVAEMVEAKSQKSKLRRATMGDRGKARRGRRWRAPASAVQHAGTARAF